MRKNLKKKVKEAIFAILPITIIVLIINFSFLKMNISILALFLSGAFFLFIGISLFTLGADMAMMPMGESMSAGLSESKKLWVILAVFFLMGFLITIAEPDLQVLANQVYAIPRLLLIISVAFGVGIFLLLFVLKSLFKIKLKYMLVVLYSIIFIVALFVKEDFIAVAFDAGGVTTGPVSVPFILALGIGLAAVRGGKSSNEDSFGMIALCSIGPILAVLILGFFYSPESNIEFNDYSNLNGFSAITMEYIKVFPHYLLEVAIALIPILICFFIFQIFLLKLPKTAIIRIIIGIIYTYVGLSIFLTAVNVGFLPAGRIIGGMLAEKSYNWILVPIGMLMGGVVVLAEPAIHILTNQVEDVTGGAISQKVMIVALTIGVAFSIGISMVRVLTGISVFYFLIPGYIIALTLSFLVPSIFTSIAFDSGGVASGPMTATFILPFAMGANLAVGGDLLTDAFGVVAMVAMTPLMSVQVFGLVYKIKLNKVGKKQLIDDKQKQDEEPVDIDIVKE
ncbi:MAG: DUF1538 domain-containing protein [Bacillota bacterium]